MSWASMCRMERKLQSSVPLFLTDHFLCPPKPEAQTSSPYSTQMPISSQLGCENSSSSFPKTSPFPLQKKKRKGKEPKKKKILSYSFSEKGNFFPEIIKYTLPGNQYPIFYMKKYFNVCLCNIYWIVVTVNSPTQQTEFQVKYWDVYRPSKILL